MITVFHAESMPRFKYEEGNSYLANLRSTDFGRFADTMSYTLVAIVDTDDLNKAYELTNHIERNTRSIPYLSKNPKFPLDKSFVL